MDIPTFNDTTEYLHANHWGITHIAAPTDVYPADPGQSWGVDWQHPFNDAQIEASNFWTWWIATEDAGYNFPLWVDMEYMLNQYANPNLVWGLKGTGAGESYDKYVGPFIDFIESNGGPNFKGYECEGLYDSGAQYLRAATEKKIRQWVWAYGYSTITGPSHYDALWQIHGVHDDPPDPPVSMTVSARLELCDELLYEMNWPWCITDCLRVVRDMQVNHPDTPVGLTAAVQDGADWDNPPWNLLHTDSNGLPFEQITQVSTPCMYYLYSQLGPLYSWALEAPIFKPGPYVNDVISGYQNVGGKTCPDTQHPGNCRPVGGWSTGLQQAQLVDSWPIVGGTPVASEKFLGGYI